MKNREIVAGIVAGDPAGLAGAYDKYAESLYGYCGWKLNGPDHAADAVEDTFVITVANLGNLRDPGRLRPWLYAVARSECHRRLRAGEASLDGTAALAAPPAEAGEDDERAELRGLVRAAMDGLNPVEREVIELSLRHDLGGVDLAVVLGVPRSQAHTLASHARGRLDRELGVPLVARTGRWACPTLDLMLHDWDGQLTAPICRQIARHISQCDACAYRRHSALRPAALEGMAPLAALPGGLREKVLALCGDDSPLGQAYRGEVTQRAGPFGANGFPEQDRQPKGRMLLFSGAAAASAILIAIVATAAITVFALATSHTPGPVDHTRSRGATATASAAVTATARAAPVSPSAPPASSQPESSAPPPVVVASPSRAATSSPSAFRSPPPTPAASTSSACSHPLPHHRCHR